MILYSFKAEKSGFIPFKKRFLGVVFSLSSVLCPLSSVHLLEPALDRSRDFFNIFFYTIKFLFDITADSLGVYSMLF